MGLNAVKVLGISVTTDSKNIILEYIRKYLTNESVERLDTANNQVGLIKKPLCIVTPNPEQVILATQDIIFRNILNRADIAIPDGIGLVKAIHFLSKVKSQKLKVQEVERYAGIDVMMDLAALGEELGVGIGLIGGRDGVALKAFECLQKYHPNIRGFAYDGPELTENFLNTSEEDQKHTLRDSHKLNKINTNLKVLPVNPKRECSPLDGFIDSLINTIIKKNASIIFIGLGAPKQEYVMDEVVHRLSFIVDGQKDGVNTLSAHDKQSYLRITNNDKRITKNHPLILMSVGGAFDMIAGRIQRAPVIIRSIGLEWLWRLIREPWRWRRQLALVAFMGMVFGEMVSRMRSSRHV